MNNRNLDEAKAALPIAALWSKLGIGGTAPLRDGQVVSCPFGDRHKNGDKNPSFNTHGGGLRFKCFACGVEGSAVDLIALVEGTTDGEACKRLLELAGQGNAASRSQASAVTRRAEKKPSPQTAETRPRVALPALERGGGMVHLRLMRSRSISFGAVDLALRHGALGFGEVCGYPSWVLGDASRRVVEARRLDRLPFPAVGKLCERKAHSLKGSDKSWPLGVELLRELSSLKTVLLVEGGPDFLAALHFIYEREAFDTWPCAMLGRAVGGIHPEALALLAGRRVRIYPHADADGGGVVAAKRWSSQLAGAGCDVDGFSFWGLRQRDGAAVKDLNDACLICDEDRPKLEGLLP